jgi:hypothetical protein
LLFLSALLLLLTIDWTIDEIPSDPAVLVATAAINIAAVAATTATTAITKTDLVCADLKFLRQLVSIFKL